jgi:hypothetical protein
MRIFKCINTDTEVLCDNDRVMPVVDDVVYAVEGRMIEIGGEDFGLAANVDEDAEEGAVGEGTADGKRKVVDIIHNYNLVETNYDKKSYMAYIKGYMKLLMEKIKASGDEERAKAFAANAQTFVKKVLGEFDEYQFFLPSLDDNANPDEAIIVLAKWEGETPTFFFWKDGLKGEKV